MSHTACSRRPLATLQTAANITKTVFGIKEVLEVKEFKSFSDRNFYIRGISTASLNSRYFESEGEFVLKIYNSKASQNVELIDAENQVIQFLRDNGFPCPGIIPAKNGELKVPVDLPISDNSCEKTKEVCIARLLTLVPGVELNDIQEPSKYLFYKLGQFIGHASHVLKDFSHPAFKTRKCMWDIKSFPLLSDLLREIEDEEVKRIVTEVLISYQKNVIPYLNNFRTGTINGDISGENILVSKSDNDRSGYEISGFIDFDVVVESLILNEVVAPMVYFMDRGVETSGYILAGYQSSMPIPRMEFDCLYHLAAARLCQVLVLSIVNIGERLNNNNEYVKQTIDKYLNMLKKYWAHSKHEMEQIWMRCQEL